MPEVTRRQYLVGTASASAVLAGCLGDSESPDPESFDTGDRPALGPSDAPVTVVTFEDFACPHCQRFHLQEFPPLFEQYIQSGDVRYLHADFPIPVHDTWSYAVPSAAWAVFEASGNQAFWEFTTAIFTRQAEYSYDVIAQVAEEVAGVGNTARTAAETDEYRDRVEDDLEQGDSWGVSSTPTVFVDSEEVDATADAIGAAIEQEL
jgi:protein-disulfide isomerase